MHFHSQEFPANESEAADIVAALLRPSPKKH